VAMARTLSRPLFSTSAAIVPSGRKWQLRRFPSPNLPFSFREEFRAPRGVRKSARNEPAGRRLYGYFCFRLSVSQTRPAVGSVGRDAICRKCPRIGWVCRWELPARGSFEASLTTVGANSSVGRNGRAAAGNCGMPCRVTVTFSRLVECSVVVRGADASARTSR
jgi:hypothetical protein